MQQLEKRGNYITCQQCKYKFKFDYLEHKQLWIKNKYKCPVCKELYCNKPKTERTLFSLQDQYFLLDRNKEIFEKMIKILLDYAKSLILKSYSSYVKFLENLDYYANNAVAFVIEEYLAKENFKIDHSFGGFLNRKIKQAIFRKEEHLTPGETLDFIFEDGNQALHKDELHDMIKEMEHKWDKVDLCIQLSKVIFSIGEYCSPYEDYKRIHALRHYLVDGEKKADKLFQEEIEDEKGKIVQHKTYGRHGKYKYLQTLDFLRKMLKDWSIGE